MRWLLCKVNRILQAAWFYKAVAVALFMVVLMIVAYGVWKDRWVLFQEVKRLTVLSVASVSVAYVFALTLGMLGWTAIMSDISPIRRPVVHFHIYALTNVGRRVPFLPWHIVSRVYMYGRLGAPKSLVVIGSWIEQVLVFVSGIMVYVLSLVWNPRNAEIRVVWLVAAIGLGMLAVHPQFLKVVTLLFPKVEFSSPNLRDLALWSGIYMATWCVGGVSVGVLVCTLVNLTPAMIVSVVGAWSLSGAVSSLAVILPSGLGVREVTLALLLLPYMPLTTAAVVSLAMRVVTTVLDVLWGGCWILLTWNAGRSRGND